MSLAVSFCTVHGIVMSADRCITTTLESGASFCSTMSERKLFLSQKGFGFSYSGSSSFNGIPASYWMKRFISRFDNLELSLRDYLIKLCMAFRQLNSSNSITINGCGYQNSEPYVYSCTLPALSIKNFLENQKTTIMFSGETTLAKAVVNALPIEYQKYNVADAIDFVKHLTFTVSNIQRFAQSPITVSPQCDILLIQQEGAKWIIPPVDMF